MDAVQHAGKRDNIMLQLALQCRDEATMEACAVCGRSVQLASGYQLRTIDNLDAVCPDCADCTFLACNMVC